MSQKFEFNIRSEIRQNATPNKKPNRSITIGCQIKISECELIRGSSFKNIPKIFYNSKIINIIQNKDKKCFLYCYIRKYLNSIKKHSERVSEIDKEFTKKLGRELNYNFDDVKIEDLPKIGDLLETNIYVYSCNKNLKEKTPVYKSDKNFEKFLDLLLFENNYMLIKNIDRFFYPNVKSKSYFCRLCCNTFFSQKKYDEHSQFCNSNKTMILMPSTKKYLKFYNWQNTIKHNFAVYADIESYMEYNNEKYNHKHLMSGYYLDCVDKRYSKKVQFFDKLEDFRDNFINELDYVEKINKTVLSYKIDMSTFDQKKYDETVVCPYCKCNFNEVNRKVIHHNHSLKKNNIIDYICNSCNLKIKHVHELIVIFHNSKGYNNSYMINIFSEIPNIRINCLSENQEKFKMLSFNIPNKKYKIKIIDNLAFLQGNLDNLSKELDNKLKIVTKKHFNKSFKLVNKKLENIPYMYVKPDNLYDIDLPEKQHFNNILTMKDITDVEYDDVKLFYKNMGFKNLKEYLECYLTSDITLFADVFNNFRNIIFDQFQLDCVKYISSLSLSKDCGLKYSKY